MDNRLKIINYLGKNLHKHFTMHELSKLLKIPYASFYRTIQKMKELLVIEITGRAKTIKLNLELKIIKSYLAITSEMEKKEYLQKQPIIKKITNEIETNDLVVLFGSYAKNIHTEKSDIDLLIINNKGDRSISFSKYEMLFKKKINAIFVTKKEFQLMLKEKEENVGKQVLKNHIVLKNPEKFWEVVLNAI